MQKVSRAVNLLTQNKGYFSILHGRALPTKEYDVVIVGANLGSILANHLSHSLPQGTKVFVCYDNANIHFHQQRILYEQGHLSKKEVNISVKSVLKQEIHHSEGVGVKKFRPHDNEILLRNNQVIKYNHMVIAMGQKNNFKSITGFEEAWEDPAHPFYACQDHKNNIKKAFPYLTNFGDGESIVYMPPSPYAGTIENFNFFVSKMMWDQQKTAGKLGNKAKFTLINGNGNFADYCPKVDSFIRTEAQRRNINIQTNLKLIRVKKNSNTAIFQDLKTGQLQERVYSSFYSMMPVRAHHRLLEAGLSSHNGYLSVNKYTLQHSVFGNIFGMGDVNDIPTTKTFFGGFNQLNVVRNNLERIIQGLPLNASFDGSSVAPLYLGLNKLAWFHHFYDGIAANTIYDALGVLGNLQYEKYLKSDVKDLEDIYKFKSWGPPHYKHRKMFNAQTIVQCDTMKVFAKIHPMSYSGTF